MSKTVTIPTCISPFEVMVNGKKYTYPAGETVVVPDEVALVIEQHWANHNPKTNETQPPFRIPGGGNANIDVTAAVGQTIRVKAVDADGKPTEWEAVDYQPRTHYCEVAEILPETTVEIAPDTGMGLIAAFTAEGGKTYTITYNGVEYECNCIASEGQFFLGNIGAIVEGAPVTEDPFVLVYADIGSGTMATAVIPLDGSATVTLSIEGEVVRKIPDVYMPDATKAYYVNITADDDGTLFTSETPENLMKEYKRGRALFAKSGIYVYQLLSVDDSGGGVEFCSLRLQQNGNLIIEQIELGVVEGAYTVTCTAKSISATA